MSFRRSWQGSLADDALDTVERTLRRAGMKRGERYISKVIDHKGISDQGDLKGSINTKINREPGRVSLEVGPDAKHAPFVQFGTRPHWAPIAPLRAWARRKLGDASAGYAVQKKIAREGTDPQDFLTGPGRKLSDEVPALLEDDIADRLNTNG